MARQSKAMEKRLSNPPKKVADFLDNYAEMRAAFFIPAGMNEPDNMHQEKADARYVREDHTAMANLSPNGYQVEFRPDRYMQRLGTDRGITYPGYFAKED
jgi:hypothetical protein